MQNALENMLLLAAYDLGSVYISIYTCFIYISMDLDMQVITRGKR